MPSLKLGKARAQLARLWGYRRWAYAAYMLLGVLRIPARTGFHLRVPLCDMRLTSQNVAASLTKVPHIVLFGFFFVLTLAQFDRIDRKTVAWSFLATVGLGVLIELEEGATRTGYCRMTDVAPDACGALIALAPVMAALMIQRRWKSRSKPIASGTRSPL
jgi:hypothetical protein